MLGLPVPESCSGKCGEESASVRPIVPGKSFGCVGLNDIIGSVCGVVSVLASQYRSDNEVRSGRKRFVRGEKYDPGDDHVLQPACENVGQESLAPLRLWRQRHR